MNERVFNSASPTVCFFLVSFCLWLYNLFSRLFRRSSHSQFRVATHTRTIPSARSATRIITLGSSIIHASEPRAAIDKTLAPIAPASPRIHQLRPRYTTL